MHIILATIMPDTVRRPPWTRFWLSLLFSVVAAGIFMFLNLGRWLDREDPLQKAAAIAVLSGKMPDRALEAARLYQEGYAPQIWISYSAEPSATLQKYGIPFAGEETYDRLLLLKQGVPESAIRILDPPIINTAEEMHTFGLALRNENVHRVILVTSKLHTRRTAALWRLISRKDGEALVHGVPGDAPMVSHWWGSTGSALDVVREVLGLLNAWAGLPLQPAS